MRLLYVTPSFPYPLTTGCLRHYFFIKELSRRHTITLLAIVNRRFEPSHLAAMEPFTERVLTFHSTIKSRSLVEKAARRVRMLVGQDPAVRELCRTIRQLTGEQSFDAVLLGAGETAPALRHVGQLPIVVDLCDAVSMYVRRAIPYARPSRLPLLVWDYFRVRRIEKELVKTADQLFFASCRDREAILGASADEAAVIPNGVDLDYWCRRSRQRGANTIVFTGGMDYPPNTDAALLLIREILPRIRQSMPKTELWIVGRDPPRRLVAAGRRPGVVVTGWVDDVRPYLERATVFAAPLRFGAGIQNKLLEAMAMEVPVVASPLAADGLRTEKRHCPPVTIAATAEASADCLARVLQDHPQHPQPDATLRRFVAQHFVWERNGEKLDEVIHKAVGKRR